VGGARNRKPSSSRFNGETSIEHHHRRGFMLYFHGLHRFRRKGDMRDLFPKLESESRMEDFSWVTRRLECTSFEAFKKLQSQVEKDVKIRNEAIVDPNRVKFTVSPGGASACCALETRFPLPSNSASPVR
jgi:hypothetical protein